LKQYDIGVTDLLKYDVKWSPSREQLLYIFYGESHSEVLFWQARNMRKGTHHDDRFYTGGEANSVIACYEPLRDTAVIVEDAVSGIKVAKAGYTGVPVFGAKMSAGKVTRLCNMYEDIVWWLDSDKFSAAVKQSNICKMLGVRSRVVTSGYDPKEYSIPEIQDFIDDVRVR
jgi:hypothetical protein